MPTLAPSRPLPSSSPFLHRPLHNPSLPFSIGPVRPILARPIAISCNVALKTDTPPSVSSPSDEPESPARIGARVRVKVPVKVYHVPKVDEINLSGKEGVVKQYVGLWKGKRISANLPFKVEFVVDVEGRGPLKFFAHLKEDEFDYID